MTTPKRAIPAMLTVLLAAGAALASPALAGEEKAPAVRLMDIEGRSTEIVWADAPVTLVNFWATWCVPCRAEMPQIERISRKYGEKGFRAVGIALESGEPADVKDFIKGGRFDLSYTLLVGDDAVSDGFGGVEIVPTTFLVGRDGAIISRHLGVTEEFESMVSREIEQHLAAGDGEPQAGSGR